MGPYAYRAAPLPFTPEELLLKPLQLPVRGTFAGTIEDTRAGIPFHLEDSFSTGLSRWTGATADWRLDAAGVRPCSRALFGPSLEARDYVLEFLAKVERGAISWVFRAGDLTNFYARNLDPHRTAGSTGFRAEPPCGNRRQAGTRCEDAGGG